MRNNGNKTVTDTPRLLAPGGPDVSNWRSSRNAPTPSRDRCPTRLGNATTPCSDRQQKGARHGVPKVFKTSASNSSLRDSNRTSSPATSSKKGTEEQMSEHDRIGNDSSSSKKRKRMDSRRYLRQFMPLVKANATDVDVATADRVGKENASSGHVADSNIAMLCEGSRSIEKNKRYSSDPVCKVPKRPISGLHETSETRVDQCTAPFSEVQPHKPTDMCLQNRASESSLAVEARDRPTGPTRQSCIPSLQSVPISPIHHEEPKSTLGNGEPITVHGEDSSSRQFKVTPSDETDDNSKICVACGTLGALRSCDGKGCKSRYHISCLDPSLENLYTGIWFCTSCTKKRFQFGLHSIVDGIESVWDVKEAKGLQNGKQYFVKYKNLAHVHNRWVPEGDITNVTPGGPDLLSLFNKNHTEKTIWKQEWTKPHRLLRKRLLMPPKLADEFVCSPGANFSYCNVEWLVKWRGLGYDHATWELETLPCLREAGELKKNYENRCEAAKQSSIPKKTKKVKQSLFQKLERLPDGCHPDFDNDHLCSINQLREFWYNSHGAVLVDDKECVIKTILFTMAVLPDVCQPFLIVTTPASLSLWEVQFNNLAPFINVVVYDGGKDNLKLIQDLEFYDNRSCIMLQVLLSHPDAILEDIEPIACIGWEAVVVDYYQNSALKYLGQLKQLSTDFRLLLLSSPIKDNLPEYMKLLAFLNSGEHEKENYVDTADALVMSKVKFTRHIAYERQADPSNFLEYWVPSYISQLQLEIYCSLLLSNSSVLQSQMETDSVGALCDILTSLSKCCDHPYLVDEFLRSSPVNNHDQTKTTDTRVHACGKLLLLDKMLKEIRNKRLRVIILFQTGGAGGNPMGDILEGVVRHRFGPESYERVERGAPISRKQVAVNMFNDKTKGRFVFLIENRACLPSIRLSSVDAIIIYNSDWNPLNDLKALQRIKIESQFKYVSIFRLYTPFTMEEKRLVLAKHGMHIDNNIQGIMCSLSHSLISWGASFLFTRFDELQQDNYASKSSERDTHFIDKVISEFLTKLPTNVEDSTKINSTSISKANMSGKFYSRGITLIGEKEGMPALDGDPPKFWLNVLDGKSPRWSFIFKPPQSSHRVSQNMEVPAKVPAEEADEARRKRRKVGEITSSYSKGLSDNSHDDMLPGNCTSSSPPFQPLDGTQQKLGVKKLMSTPKNLHVRLKQELSKLIKVLQLPDNVRFMVEQFFEYALKNHLVVREPIYISHAFNIALCWCAASLLHYKIDRRESLALAEKCLNYECNDELAGLFYGKLRILKKKFPRRAGETSIKYQPTSVEDTQLSWHEASTNLRNGHMSQEQTMDLHGNFTNGAPQEGSSGAEQLVSEGQELISVQETQRECHLSNDEFPNMIVEKIIYLIDNVFSLRENKILCKQQLEISGLDTHTQNKVIRLKDICNLVLEHIRRSHIDEMTRNDKIKQTVQWFTMLMYAFLEHMRLQHDKLEALQSNTWSAERQLKENFHQEAKSGQLDQDFDQHIALPDSNFVMEEFIHFKGQNDEYRTIESSVSDCQQPSNDGLLMEITLVRSVNLPEPISTRPVQNEPVETFVDSDGGPASEAIDFAENRIRCNSDGVGLQRAGCSSSTITANDDPVGQESSMGECRNTEHVERDNIANPSVRGVNANNDDTLDTDQVHLEPPILASSQSLVALPVSREVGTHANLLTMPVEQTVGTLQHLPIEASTNSLRAIAAWDFPPQQWSATSGHPPADAESASILRTETARDLQPGVQPSASILDAPLQSMHPDHSSQTGHQPETSPGLSQGGGTYCHLRDVRQGVDANNSKTVCADQDHLESPTCAAPQIPAIFPVSEEIETQIDQSSVPAQKSTSLPPHKMLATSGHPPADAEPASILRTEAAWDLQPGVQPSASISDAPLQIMHPDHSSHTGHQPETSPGLSEGGGTCRRLGDARKGVDANNSTTVCADQAHLESPTCAAPQIPAIFPVSRVETQADQSSVPAQQRTSLSPHIMLASSGHLPADAESASILRTEAARDLQLGVQPLASISDAPLQRMHLNHSSQTGHQPETSLGLSQGDRACRYLGDTRTGVDANIYNTVCADQSHSESLTCAAPQISAIFPVSGEVGTRADLSSMFPQQSTDLCAQQNVAPSQCPPAEAERTGLLGTPVVQDLQPEVQSSILFSDASLQRMHLDDRSQTSCQPDRVTGLSQGGAATSHHLGDVRMQVKAKNDGNAAADPVHSESPTYTAYNPVTLPVSTGVETQTFQSSMPVEQSTCLPAQQGLATLRHPPAEAEPASILVTEAAWVLQPEVQPSTSTQGVPFERTYLSAMPVLQSPTVHRSVEPSWDPNAVVESTRTLGILQSEIQLSASMQDQSAEAERAGTSGTTAAQDLLPEMQSSTTVQHVPLDRTHSEERRQIGFRPNTVPGPEQPTQLPPVTTLVFNNPILSDKPLKNELDRLIHCGNLLSKAHEQKKSLLLIEYNQEIEKVKRKYDSLLQKEDSAYLQRKRELADIYGKVFVNQSLAENFRRKFTPSSVAQGRSRSPVMEQPLQSSSVAQTAALSVISSSAIQQRVFHSPGPYVRPSLVAQPSSSRAVQLESIIPGDLYGATSSPFIPVPVPHVSYGSAGAQSHAVQPQSILPGNLYRVTSSPFIPTPLPHSSYGSAGAQSRAPTHLQQLRMPLPYAIHTNQQQPSASTGLTSLRQFVPGIMDNFALTSPQAGAILNSITPNSVHQTMPSTSSSRTAIPASTLPSGPHPDPMANLVQSSSSNPILMAAQQPSSPNIVFHSTSGPLNAAPGSRHTGAQIAGVNQSGSESALLNAWLTARLGLTSDTTGAGSSAEVVCLSDDEP